LVSGFSTAGKGLTRVTDGMLAPRVKDFLPVLVIDNLGNSTEPSRDGGRTGAGG
jgi:hypothetical protein